MKHVDFLCVTTIENASGDEWTTNLLNTKKKKINERQHIQSDLCVTRVSKTIYSSVFRKFPFEGVKVLEKNKEKNVIPSSDIEFQRVEFVIFIHS